MWENKQKAQENSVKSSNDKMAQGGGWRGGGWGISNYHIRY